MAGLGKGMKKKCKKNYKVLSERNAMTEHCHLRY